MSKPVIVLPDLPGYITNGLSLDRINDIVRWAGAAVQADRLLMQRPTGDPPYQTLPWVARFLNRRHHVVEEMRELLKQHGGQQLIQVTRQELKDWVIRLEVEDAPQKAPSEEARAILESLAPVRGDEQAGESKDQAGEVPPLRDP